MDMLAKGFELFRHSFDRFDGHGKPSGGGWPLMEPRNDALRKFGGGDLDGEWLWSGRYGSAPCQTSAHWFA